MLVCFVWSKVCQILSAFRSHPKFASMHSFHGLDLGSYFTVRSKVWTDYLILYIKHFLVKTWTTILGFIMFIPSPLQKLDVGGSHFQRNLWSCCSSQLMCHHTEDAAPNSDSSRNVAPWFILLFAIWHHDALLQLLLEFLHVSLRRITLVM